MVTRTVNKIILEWLLRCMRHLLLVQELLLLREAIYLLDLLIVVIVLAGYSGAYSHLVVIHLFQKDTLVFIKESVVALRLEQILVHHVVDCVGLRLWLLLLLLLLWHLLLLLSLLVRMLLELLERRVLLLVLHLLLTSIFVVLARCGVLILVAHLY